MKARILILILLLAGTCLFGQISYEKGYIIFVNGKRQECFVKNMDWKNNPSELNYKINLGDEPLIASTETVKEFVVYGNSKFVSYDVKIDTYVADLSNLTYEKNPTLSDERLYLKVLIEGAATLYSYNNGNLLRFFYSTSDTVPQQLIYREYLKGDGTYGVNNRFRQQLWNDLKCICLRSEDVERVSYYSESLRKFFRRYNECVGSVSEESNNKGSRDFFDLSVVSGANFARPLTVENGEMGFSHVDFNSKINYSLGLRGEIILPFNKGKWRVLCEPVYHHYSSETEVKYNYYQYCKTTLNFSLIDLSFGLRHCFYLNDNTSFFLDGLYNYGLPLKDSKLIYENLAEYDLAPIPWFAFGGGVNYKKISVQMRYFLKRDLMYKYVSWYAGYENVSLTVGYKLF